MEKNPGLYPQPHLPHCGWAELLVEHQAGEGAPFHYHEVEEWLRVVEGQVTFFSAGELVGRPTQQICVTGDVLRIPQGEVHRVEVGPAGVKYWMWTPVPSWPCFQRKLDPDLEDLIKRNLTLPEVENRYDERIRTGDTPTPQDQEDDKFLTAFVSTALTMRTARGGLLDHAGYTTRGGAAFIRGPSASIRILHRTTDPESVLLSTVVHTTDWYTGTRQQITNIRHFVKEDRVWKCRIWVNYPEPGAS